MAIKHSLLLVFILIVAANFSFAQKELRMEHDRKKTIRVIKEGQRIFYKRYSDTHKHTGRLNEIRDSILIVDGQPVDVASIEMIGRKPIGLVILKSAAMVVGVPLFAFGTAQLFFFGPVASVLWIGSGDWVPALGAFLDITFGSINRITGLLPWLTKFKRYRVPMGWKISVQS